MKNKHSYLSKLLSVVLAIVMCLSVCVLDWSGLVTESYAISQGAWTFRWYVNVYNTDGDANGPYMYFNGSNNWNANARNGGDQYSGNFTSTSWPSSARATASTKNPDIGFNWYLQVYSSLNGSWTTIASNGWSDTRGKDGTSTRNASYDNTQGISGTPYIYARGVSGGAWTVTANNYGGATQSKVYSAYCYDQYGVNRPASVSWSIPTNYNRLSVSSSSGDSTTVYVPAAQGEGNHTNTLRCNIGGTNYDTSITVNNNYYYIDLNGTLDGDSSGNISGYGKSNVVVNGSTVGSGVTDYYTSHPSGSTYSISNAGADSGRTYIGGAVSNQRLVGSNVAVNLEYRTNSTLVINPNTGTYNGTAGNTTYTKYWGQTQSISNPTKDGWVWDGWSVSGSTVGSLSGTTFTFNTKTVGQTEIITAKWHRAITNTYHWLKADATTDQTGTVSGTAYDTATTIALTAPTNSVTTVGKNDKTWTFKGWKETTSVTWGSASAAADIGNGASHSVSTTSSNYTFYPVYALATTKFYANYNYLTDNGVPASIQKNATVNGDAANGAMPVPTGSDNGSGAELARYYSDSGKIYELQGWSLTDGGAVQIPYNNGTTTLGVPGAGTPTSTANLTPIELYPVYDLYATAIHTHFHYKNASGTDTYIDVSGQARGTSTSGTVTFPGSDQITSQYTVNGITYYLVGWNAANNSTDYQTFGTQITKDVLADPANDYYDYYPVYKTITTSRYYYFAANGTNTSMTKTTTDYKCDTIIPTTTDVEIPETGFSTITLDGRTFTFRGWRKDTVNSVAAITAVTENHNIQDAEYVYYAVYDSTITLSYNTTHTGITATPIPANQTFTQYINAGANNKANANINNASSHTFALNFSDIPVKTGYTFIGWDLSDSETESAAYKANGTTSYTTKVNTTMYARFRVNTLNVKFVWYNGGLTDGFNEQTKTVSYDDLKRADTASNGRYVVTAPTVNKNHEAYVHADDTYHYYFLNWARSDGKGINTQTSGDQPTSYVATFKNVTEDITIQAQYQGVSHRYVVITKDEYGTKPAGYAADKLATCVEDGVCVKRCLDCGYTDWDAVIPNKGGHQIITEGIREATCTTTGSTGYDYCTVCNMIAREAEVIPATGHNFVFKETVAATCTAQGYDLYVCANNDTHQEKRNFTDVIDHTASEPQPGKEPTCTEDGYTEFIKCTVCQTVLSDKLVLPKLGHTLTYHAAKANSCTEDGNIAYYSCSVCNKNFTDAKGKNTVTEVIIPATGHNYEVVGAGDATCTTPDHAECKICSYCGEIVALDGEPYTYEPEYPEGLGHDFPETGEYINADFACVEGSQGYYLFKCRRAGCTAEYRVWDTVAEHTMVDVAEVPATCKETGKTAYSYCSVCGYGENSYEVLPLAEHNYQEAASYVAPTCEEPGYTKEIKCVNCGEIKQAKVELPALGHAYYKMLTAKEATCTEDGYKIGTCARCGNNVTETIAAEGHVFVESEGAAPTCENNGVKAGKSCIVCGYMADESGEAVTDEERIIPALGHSFENNNVVETKPSTCTVKGYTIYKCDLCDYEKTEFAALAEHTPETIPAVEATCTATGLTAGVKCSVCGAIITAQTKTAPKGHTKVTVAAVEPTCQTVGSTSYIKCSVCGEIIVAPVEKPVVDCSYGAWTYVSQPDCVNAGLKTRVCKWCEAVDEQEIPAIGHNFVFVAAVEATCTKDGKTETKYCTRCGEIAEGYTASEVITAKHNFVVTVVEPTCGEKGYTKTVCSVCGKTTITDYVDATGAHTGGSATCTEKAVCEVCGQHYGAKSDHLYTVLVEEESYAPTCIKKGKDVYKCEVCGAKKSVYTDVVDHTYNEANAITVPATCTNNGSVTYICEVCGKQFTDSIAATGVHHDDDGDGYCDECGKKLASTDPSGEGQGEGGATVTDDDGCPKCGYHEHNANSLLFKEDGIYCKVVQFLRKVVSFFRFA